MSVTLLVDGNNCLVRSIKAMERTNLSSHGVPTGAVLTFINMLSRYVKEVEPTHVVVCWDGGVSTFRRSIFSGYKAARPERTHEHDMTPFALAKEFLSLANIHHVEHPGVEADDLVAAYCNRRLDPVVILSGDKDFLQLLEDEGPAPVSQIRPGTGVEETWTAKRVEHEMECKPAYIPKVMALTGDSGDGIPGVPGFGTKTAVKALIAHDWNLGKLVYTDDPKWAKKVGGFHDLIALNLRLVNLREPMFVLDVPPLPRFEPTPPPGALAPTLLGFLERWELASVRERFVTGTLWKER